ncbi:MAG: ABC transporter ATP-binding protein [Leptolyngbyaceae cyanobacterium SM1_1_3]|nr:ABC transporter ATP-binding protein [Leptolyngbyaceae cyanobacterium SM1_1_3]NJN04831.1 ABC transporter ATP-binding protein [Leptolyngbyaceae cyanobacterium RM1_1_2]NJO11405.1 ABC transporter ATP-binding protein [Leptolyngbyaceae cyanobacterium SL_1_1]
MSFASYLSAVQGSDRQQESDWRLLLRLLPYVKAHRRSLVWPMFLLIPLALANALQPVLVGQAISLIRQEPVLWFLENQTLRSGLNLVVTLLLLTVAVRLTLDGLQSYLVQKVGQRITASIRDDLFEHVTSLAVRFFDRTPVGKLITRLTSDVDALGDVFSTGAIGIVSDIVSILVLLVTMFVMQWQLALMLVMLLLPVTWLIIYFQQQYRKANYKAREKLSELNAALQENVSGIDVVQLFRRESFNAELFRNTNQSYVSSVDKTIFHDSAVSSTLEWVSLVAIAGVLGLGGLLAMRDAMTFGVLASFILFAQRLFDPLRQFADKFTAIQAGFTAIERIQDLLNEPIEIQDPEQVNRHQLPQSTTVPGEIRFKHVWFGYKPDEYVLHDLDFTIQPGEKVALVGPTGAGKSSIIRLLCRLYDVSKGEILLDGVNIRDLPQSELRRRMAVILQDGFLFAGDIKSNITLGEDYSLAEVQQAAKNTNVAQLIEQLPQGYDTSLRERGTNLSGGQKQLLAFARAAIRNPGILILDEATANLDVGTEALIQDALDKLLVNRTAIVIAHRLSTIRNVDRILVLKQGRLVEQGSHDELLAKSGLYASLYRLQMLET